jgi:signal transduction histidine kinase
MVWISNADGAVTFVNRKWRTFTARTFRAALDDGWIESVHPDDRIGCLDEFYGALQTRRPLALRYRMRRADGLFRGICHLGMPLYEENGLFAGYLGACFETDDDDAEAAARRADHLRRAAVNAMLLDGLIAHMNDGVLADTGDGHEPVVNDAFRRMFGIPQDATSLQEIVRRQLLNPSQYCPAVTEEGMLPPTELRLTDGRILEHENFPVRFDHDRLIHIWQFRDITSRKKAEEELRASRHRIRDLSAHLEAAREEERRELARALHDEIGQLLTGIRLEVAAAVQKFQDSRLPENFAVVDRLQAAVGLVDLSISTVQRISTALRPPILDHLGLIASIRWEAAVFERRTRIRCRVSCVPAGLDTRTHITVFYRILLEALTNVARHANAGTVWIQVRQKPNRLIMDVRDNGRGISDEAIANPQTMGLLGMRERALSVGGEVRVTRLRSGGTSVLVDLPLDGGHELTDRTAGADA